MKTKILFMILLSICYKVNCQVDTNRTYLNKYKYYTNKIDSLKEKVNGTNTTVSFGLSDHTTNTSSLTKINSSISINNQTYPSEFKLNLKTETQVENGKIRENISELLISYDYYPSVKDSNSSKANDKSINRKGFVFVNRYADKYLGIEEKYELGIGGLWNFWIGDLIKKGDDNQKIIDKFNDTSGDDLELVDIVKKDYRIDLNDLRLANKINFTKLRIAILVGLYYEIEKMVFTDSLSIDSVKKAYPANFAATSSICLEVRPTIEWNLTNNLKLTSRCYLKLPIKSLFEKNSVRLKENNIQPIDTTDSRTDYFIDFQNSLTYEFNKNMELSIEYRFMYDNAPQRKFVLPEGSDKCYLVKPDQRHHYFGLAIKVKF